MRGKRGNGEGGNLNFPPLSPFPLPLHFLMVIPFPLHFLILSSFPRSPGARLPQAVTAWLHVIGNLGNIVEIEDSNLKRLNKVQ